MSIRSFRSNARSQSPKQSKAARIYTSTDQTKIVLEELNQLFAKADLPTKNLDKLAVALEHSVLCISAISFRDQKLVGFVRATGDGVFNITAWDLAVDPDLEDPEATKILLLKRLKQEVKRSGLQCAISVLAEPQDLDIWDAARFAEDPDGITAMAFRPSVSNQGQEMLNQSLKSVRQTFSRLRPDSDL